MPQARRRLCMVGVETPTCTTGLGDGAPSYDGLRVCQWG
jgi:hypothetical protein